LDGRNAIHGGFLRADQQIGQRRLLPARARQIDRAHIRIVERDRSDFEGLVQRRVDILGKLIALFMPRWFC